MSTIVDRHTDTSEMSAKDRSILATRHLCEALGIGPITPKTINYLTIALAETAADEVVRNAEFGQRVRAIFSDLIPQEKPKTSRKSKQKQSNIPSFVAAGHVDESKLAPHLPPDPYTLLELLGPEQLAEALTYYGSARLKQAVAIVQQRHPNTRPVNMGRKQSLIDYILRYVITEPDSQK